MKRIKDILNSVIKDIGIKKRVEVAEFVNFAQDFFFRNFGEEITHLFVKKKVLFVGVKSPALRTELQMKKLYLINKVNQEFGKEVIEDIRFIRGK